MPLLYLCLSFFRSLAYSLTWRLLAVLPFAWGYRQPAKPQMGSEGCVCLGYVLRSNGLIWSNLEHADVKPAGSTMIFSS